MLELVHASTANLMAVASTTAPSASLTFWSGFVYWFAIISVIMTVGFTFVVIVGGFFDLRYLFRSLREEVPDANDDGRADTESPVDGNRG